MFDCIEYHADSNVSRWDIGEGWVELYWLDEEYPEDAGEYQIFLPAEFESERYWGRVEFGFAF